jgi:hypothetical protein
VCCVCVCVRVCGGVVDVGGFGGFCRPRGVEMGGDGMHPNIQQSPSLPPSMDACMRPSLFIHPPLPSSLPLSLPSIHTPIMYSRPSRRRCTRR